MNAPHVFPFPEPHNEERHFLSPHILAALQREASTSGANNWAKYAQAKLDRELHACSLLLTDEQAEMLQRYAEVLGVQPHDLLAALLAPEAARRERLWRRIKTFASAHRPRRPRGCLTLAFWPAAILGVVNIGHWLLSLLSLVTPR